MHMIYCNFKNIYLVNIRHKCLKKDCNKPNLSTDLNIITAYTYSYFSFFTIALVLTQTS